jgi:hypothetical protein
MRLQQFLVLAVFLAMAPDGPSEVADAPAFLQSLRGEWDGRAVQTPAGPTPYDIHFAWTDDECLSGTANNGFSNHTWTFCRDGRELTLDFQSDFRGNREPIRFQAVSALNGAVVFHAESHPFMDVEISVSDHDVRIDVIHHEKLHVRIELRRHALKTEE